MISKLKSIQDTKLAELAQTLPKADVLAEDTKNERTKPQVLWVDDNPTNNESIINVYQRQGVDFDLAINTSQALDCLSRRNYDLIISDMRRGSERDAGLLMIQEIKRVVHHPPPIFIYASDIPVEYAEIAKYKGASFVTSSTRNLILKMIETINIYHN
jgi:CheY-like chemotaxis protein